MIPTNAICTCGHILADHVDEGYDNAICAVGGWGTPECPCIDFAWDNGQVRE